jgi:hypothetical protein
MLKKNAEIILQNIGPSDKVLDIGGWAQPFRRANYVIDILPFETRGVFGEIGGDKEFFSKDKWIVHDVSSSKPLPFGDKEFDFVVCSHTLEDIRDPIHLCAEISRIAKKGYIETPSRIVESTIGLEGKHYTGYYHHRWLVEIEDSTVTFRFKPQLINESWMYHFPKSTLRKLTSEEKVSYLFWEGNFKYREIITLSMVNVIRELEQFVRNQCVYPKWHTLARFYYLMDGLRPNEVAENLFKKYPKTRKLVEHILRRKLVEDVKDNSAFWLSLPEIYSDN